MLWPRISGATVIYHPRYDVKKRGDDVKVLRAPYEGRSGNFWFEKCVCSKVVSMGGRVGALLMWCLGDVKQRPQTEVKGEEREY